MNAPKHCPTCGRGLSAKHRSGPHRRHLSRAARLLVSRLVRAGQIERARAFVGLCPWVPS